MIFKIQQKVKQRFGIIVISLVLLYIFVETIPIHTPLHLTMWGLLLIGYQSLLWVPRRWWTDFGRVATIICIWGLTILSWIILDMRSTAVAAAYFLIGAIVQKLSRNTSIIVALIIILSFAGIELSASESSIDSILLVVSNFVGIFVVLWGYRIKSEATQLTKLHYQELSFIHNQLEQAHADLQDTHKKLEEATVDSLRYAVLEERSRISRDIHDSIGHGLTSVIVQLQALPYVIKANSAEADATVRNVLEVARQCLKEVRTVVHEMAIDEADLGIIAMKSLVKQVQDRSGLPIELTTSQSISRWKYDISETLYRVLQEALTNVIRHAEASKVEVSLQEDDNSITMTIIDDGKFTDPVSITSGFGMSGMKVRCERVNGSFTVQNYNPHGMKLIVKLPFDNTSLEGETK
ncbi:sensor histidine kinase [Paenibacillus segetis]|uniref:histidine kinase n=1 Tax=Paenibacillus segetis TaxID=1325360 RepID=A0ABQ1YJI1_9BACL|nr:sensor histidine kinase [Paenibacillus segetis]GGH26987.1 sensor histidine kinase YxjM [Paenibacillus segetis]